ncbi:ABC transporter substrate-binding protein [Mariniluteicoccus flavus]
MKLRTMITAAATCAALAFSGCSAQPDSQVQGGGAPGGGGAAASDTITAVDTVGGGVGIEQIGTPWFNSGTLAQSVMFRGLFRAEANLTDVKDDLAAKSELSADQKTFTVTLKDGLKWSDGKPITGDDVAWSMSTLLRVAKANPVYVSAFKQVEGAADVAGGKAPTLSGVKAEGNTVTIRLTNPVGDLKQVLAQFMILPKHALEGAEVVKLDTAEFWKNPVTSGPFKVGTLSQGNFITLVPNASYEGKKPVIQKINVVKSSDPAADAAAGKVDYFTSNDPEIIKSMKSVQQFADNPVDVLFYRYFVLNLSDPANPMNNPKAREAMKYAVDWNGLVTSLYPGTGETMNSGIPDSMPEHDTSTPKYTFDTAKAKALFAEAKVDPNRPLRLRYYYTDQTSINFMTAVAQQLMDAGLKVEVLKFQGDATSELYTTKKYDVAFKGLSAFGLNEWYAEYSNTPTFGQIIGPQPEFDALNSKLSQTADKTQRSAILKDLEKLELSKQLKLPLFSVQQHVFVSKRIQGATKFGNPLYIYDNNFAEWKLS